MEPNPVVVRAIKIAGGQTKLAEALGVGQGLVWQWLNNRRPTAAKHGLRIEEITTGKVTRYDWCPRVFGPPPEKEAA